VTGSGALAIRSAQPDDAAGLALVHVRAWQAAYVGLMPQGYLDGLDVAGRAQAWLRHLREGSREFLLVATIDEDIAGFVTYGAARDAESGGVGELYALNVRPDRWSAGVGSALLSDAQDGLGGLGFDRAVLWVLPGNARARRFYERHGWAVENVERIAEIQGVTVPEGAPRQAVDVDPVDTRVWCPTVPIGSNTCSRVAATGRCGRRRMRWCASWTRSGRRRGCWPTPRRGRGWRRC
jgi:GNAT superfamily N-acetyltransferase